MKKLIALIAGLLSTSTATAAEYQVGQVWAYHTRENEESSRLYIVHIDTHERLGNIYHIFVEGVLIKNPDIEGGIHNDLSHAPVDEETLKSSLTKMIYTTSDLPDISEGYATWKEAFDSGEGGVFNIPVKQIVQCIEDAVDKGKDINY